MIKQLIRKNRIKTASLITNEFYDKGYMFFTSILSPDIISNLKNTFDPLKWLKEESIIFEKDEETPRSLFNIHNLQPDLIRSLIKDKCVTLGKEWLNNEMYIYQSHINYKKGQQIGGEYWWHSDWTFWHFEDGMLEPDALSLIFFLDHANVRNGAMKLIPGSHDFTYTDKLSRKSDNVNVNIRHNQSAYTVSDYSDEGLLMEKDIQQMKNKPLSIEGRPGDLLIMDANLWHYSPKNETNEDRKLLFLVLNSFNNQPVHLTRPHYLVERNVEKFKL